MSFIQITAVTREEATREAYERLGLPEEAMEIEWSTEEEDGLLAGARPYVQMNVRVRLDYVADQVKTTLEALLKKMDIEDAVVETLCEPNMVIASIECSNPENLIGHRGETLDSLQHLVVRMARLGGRDMPLILVDAGHYRLRRVERLKRVATNLAKMAIEKGREEDFDPMDSLDRKIVHTILKDMPGIQTYSRGEGLARQVIVGPAN